MSVQPAKNRLAQPVERLNGVTAHRAKMLAKLGVVRGVDLLFFFPRTYDMPASLTPVADFKDGLAVTFTGTIVDVGERVTQNGKHLLGVHVEPDGGGGSVRLMWFNQAYRRKQYERGNRLIVTGQLRSTVLNWEMVHPQTTPAESDSVDLDRPIPVYSLTEGLKHPEMRSIMRSAIPQLIEEIDEVLPESIRLRMGVFGIRQALEGIHFPQTMEEANQSQRRFKLQELLVLQLALSMQRVHRERTTQAPACEMSGRVHARILIRLGHALTRDQESAIEDIRHDMARTVPMNRLLQGDVGSGKTLVAQYAMLLCVANGHQAALMAPTEILARQHAMNLEKQLAHSRVRVALLTGSLSRGQRAEILEQIADGNVDLVVGTTALLSEKVQFKQIGLVIIDEQHKFGVLQRAKMRRENMQPHSLILSATPIPRTIGMTAFGDLDVSVIRTKPPGRTPVKTYLATQAQLGAWWQFVDRQIAKGRQAYVITPRVGDVKSNAEPHADEGESLPDNMEPIDDDRAKEHVANAEGAFAKLREGPFRHRRLGLLHGRMTAESKDAVLDQFATGELDILVATTVVEVGIDVPNATVITVLDADRLGLSQLHQLRGRISRGSTTGYACAVASIGSNALDNQRLQAFEKTEDGFELAELDLRLRGPGDLLGTSQTGLPPLRMANLVEDAELLDLARTTAREVMERDADLADPSLQRLVQQTLKRYGKSLQLGDVG